MIQRTIKEKLLKSIKTKPITLITGSRQVGKSTLCLEISKELGFSYVSLDDRRECAQAKTDPELFLQIHPWPLIIDEIQYAPELFAVMESIVNKQKKDAGSNYGMYILTGSQAYELMRGVTESLAGRVSLVRMSPLSASEIHGVEEKPFAIDPIANAKRCEKYQINVNDLFSLIVKGMYPELHANPEIDVNSFYSDYVTTYIERDVSKLINLKDKLKFENFMEILASLTGEELVYETIANAVGVKIATIQSWVSVLLAGDIIHLLQPYNEISIVKRIVKRPKLYFSDTGLACYLSRLNSKDTLRRSRFAGRFVETYMINEIRKSYFNNGVTPNLYYYRDTRQNEIDLIILDEGRLHFVECKTGVSFSSDAIKAFKQLEGTNYEIGNSCILCNTEHIYKVKENVFALPVSSI